MQTNENKQKILNALANVTKQLRDDKSQFLLSGENDISVSILSTIERGMKDPQLTTIFKLAEALDMKPHEFIKLIEDSLPKDFSLIDK